MNGSTLIEPYIFTIYHQQRTTHEIAARHFCWHLYERLLATFNNDLFQLHWTAMRILSFTAYQRIAV